MTIGELYRRAWTPTLRNYMWFLAGFAGIVLVWLFVEWVVILSPLAGNRVVWWVMHVGFLVTAPLSYVVVAGTYREALGETALRSRMSRGAVGHFPKTEQ